MDKQDKYAPKNAKELDHWHIPEDLKIDESSFYEKTSDKIKLQKEETK